MRYNPGASAAFWAVIGLGLLAVAFFADLGEAHGQEQPACLVTYKSVMEAYASVGIERMGAYGSVSPGSPAYLALLNEGLFVAGADTAHIFGSNEFISYVFTAGDCVLAHIVLPRGKEPKGTPA